MTCPQCGYALSAFDKECPRCQGFGITPAKPVQAAAPQSSTIAAPDPDPQTAVAPNGGGWFWLADTAIFMGLGTACYYWFFFDTSVAVPVSEFMGEQVGGGRVNNLGLMAERQDGITFGIGLAIFGAIVYFASQNRQKSED